MDIPPIRPNQGGLHDQQQAPTEHGHTMDVVIWTEFFRWSNEVGEPESSDGEQGNQGKKEHAIAKNRICQTHGSFFLIVCQF